MFLKNKGIFFDIECDLMYKLLLDNYYNVSRLKKINVFVFFFNLYSVKIFLVLKSILVLDNICMQKPKVFTYDLIFNYKKNKINFLSVVSLRGFKLFEYLFLYKYVLFSEFINNHFKQKTMYDSFKFKKLVLIPYIDEGYYKTSFYMQTRFFFSGLEYQQLLVKQSIII